MIRTTTIEEMFDVAMLLDRQPLPGGRRVAILTNAGGPGILAADACEGHGLQVTPLLDHTIAALRTFLPAAAGLQNPVDMLATASADHYAQAMRLLLADPNVDSLLTIFIPPLVTAAADVAGAMTRGCAHGKQAGAGDLHGGRGCHPDAGPDPHLPFPRGRDLGARSRHGTRRVAATPGRHAARFFDVTLPLPRAVIRDALSRGPGWLGPLDAQRVLDALGVPAVAMRLVR